MSRYEITDDGRVITIAEPNGIFSVLEPTEHGHCIDDASIGAIRQQQSDIAALTAERDQLSEEAGLLTHKVICCGVAADHPDAGLTETGAYATKWNSAQAESVRKLRRAGQLLIEEIGAGGPENADDTAERAAGVIRKQADTIAALSSQLGNLLSVIHRDGGHYESEHGMEKACADAETAVHVMRGCVDGFISSANEWRQRAEQAESRLAAIDAAPTVAWQDVYDLSDLYWRRPDPAQVDTRELIARPAKDCA